MVSKSTIFLFIIVFVILGLMLGFAQSASPAVSIDLERQTTEEDHAPSIFAPDTTGAELNEFVFQFKHDT